MGLNERARGGCAPCRAGRPCTPSAPQLTHTRTAAPSTLQHIDVLLDRPLSYAPFNPSDPKENKNAVYGGSTAKGLPPTWKGPD
jgi:hypothetical protein